MSASSVASFNEVISEAWSVCTPPWPAPSLAREMQVQVVLFHIELILEVVTPSAMGAVVVTCTTTIQKRSGSISTGEVLQNGVARSVITLSTKRDWLLAHHAIGAIPPSTRDCAIHVENREYALERLLSPDQRLSPGCPASCAATGLRISVDDRDLIFCRLPGPIERL